MARPKLLMLDEPSLGLAPLYIKRVFEIILRTQSRPRHDHPPVEQNAHHALRVAHRGLVLPSTAKWSSAAAANPLLKNPEVRAAYLEAGH